MRQVSHWAVIVTIAVLIQNAHKKTPPRRFWAAFQLIGKTRLVATTRVASTTAVATACEQTA